MILLGFLRVPYVYVKIPLKRTIVRVRTGPATWLRHPRLIVGLRASQDQSILRGTWLGAGHVFANAQTACGVAPPDPAWALPSLWSVEPRFSPPRLRFRLNRRGMADSVTGFRLPTQPLVSLVTLSLPSALTVVVLHTPP